jgi:hypothetical protein
MKMQVEIDHGHSTTPPVIRFYVNGMKVFESPAHLVLALSVLGDHYQGLMAPDGHITLEIEAMEERQTWCFDAPKRT